MRDTVPDGQFVGATKETRRFEGLTLAETDYRPGLVVPGHVHDTALVTLVLRGGFVEERAQARVPLGTGSLLYHPPNEPHSHRFDPSIGGRCFIVQFGTMWTDRMRRLDLIAPSGPTDLREARANWLASRLYREFRTPDSAAELAIEGFALAMLSEIARTRAVLERNGPPAWLRRAEDLLRSRPSSAMTMAEIAETVGVHPVHLSRTFRQHYGMTMGEYLRRVRVEEAAKALESTTRPLSDIAYTAGFADQAHFTRVFKNVMGLSPGAYRKAAFQYAGHAPDDLAAACQVWLDKPYSYV